MDTAQSAQMDRHVTAYHNSVRRNFAFLKSASCLETLFVRSIPLEDGRGLLVPVCELHADDDNLISLLSRWRADNWFAYPTQFPVTDEGTRKWLRGKLLDVADRILFLVVDKHGQHIGHLGYNSCLND